jgi:hypothetical protein
MASAYRRVANTIPFIFSNPYQPASTEPPSRGVPDLTQQKSRLVEVADVVFERMRRELIKSHNGSVGQMQSWPDVLTLQEVAQILRCSKAHICKIVNGQVSGTPQLRAIVLGRRKLVQRTTLLSWLSETEQHARIASSLEVYAGRRA